MMSSRTLLISMILHVLLWLMLPLSSSQYYYTCQAARSAFMSQAHHVNPNLATGHTGQAHKPGAAFASQILYFSMHSTVLIETSTSSTDQLPTRPILPFANPAGIFPPKNGIPILDDQPFMINGDQAVHSMPFTTWIDDSLGDHPGLILGDAMTIIGNLTEGDDAKSPVVGNAHGFYVVSLDDNTNYGPIIALTASFSYGRRGEEDSLSFFGMHSLDGGESHVPVVGRTGRFAKANGYASISTNGHHADSMPRILRFNVHLAKMA